MKKKEISLEIIKRWLESNNCYVRAAAINACTGMDVPLEIIERGLEDEDCYVSAAAINACTGRGVPLEVIEHWLESEDWCFRAAAMNACVGKDVPFEIIEHGLKDGNLSVCEATLEVCKQNGFQIPVIRTIEPPDLVYKKCVGGVIVVAEIPKNAQVRGEFGRKCRANKAIIKDVIGDVCGEPVGISIWDCKTTYYKGDEVEIEDFDMSNEECSAGFHFFCTREEAESCG